MNTSTQRPLKF